MTTEKEFFSYMEERFGISRSHFREFGIYSDQKGRVFMAPKKLAAEDIAITVGMQIARTGKAIKPSTNFLQAFGRHAGKGILPLAKEQAVAYARGEDIKVHARPDGISDGYVLLKYLDFPMGCGLLKDGQIKNVLPKARRMQVKFL